MTITIPDTFPAAMAKSLTRQGGAMSTGIARTEVLNQAALWSALIPNPVVAPPLVTPPTAVPGTVRPFSSSSPWNTPTPAGTAWFDCPELHAWPAWYQQFVDPNATPGTAANWWISTLSAHIYYASASDPVWTFNLPAINAPTFGRVRPATTIKANAPAGITAYAGDGDSILMVVQPDGSLIECWSTVIDSTNRTVTAPVWATSNILTSPGAGTTGGLADGVRASNFSWVGGLITGLDLKRSAFDHALVCALPRYMLHTGNTPTFRAPATAWDNHPVSATLPCGPIMIGSRLGIPKTTPKPAGLTAMASAVFDCLQTYGCFVGDWVGGAWPTFYADGGTVIDADVAPLYQWPSNSTQALAPVTALLRVADYQPPASLITS